MTESYDEQLARWDAETASRDREIERTQRKLDAHFRLVRADALTPHPVIWQVHDLFESSSTLLLFGDPETGKSFMALDLACCIATGTLYHGRAVRKGAAVYIAGEGFYGLARRKDAWSIHHGIDLADTPLYFSTAPAALTQVESRAMVMRAIDETGDNPAFICLDTLSRNMGPGDENSTEVMREIIAACDDLRVTYGATICLLHHSGHADKSRARGSTVLGGAIDMAYRLTRKSAGLILVECTKAKDCPRPDTMAFEFRAVDLPIHDKNGSLATSAVLHSIDVPRVPTQPAGKWQKQANTTLLKIYQEHQRGLVESGCDPNQARVRIEEWREACTSVDMPRQRFHDAKKRLDEAGLIELEPPYVRPTSGSPISPVP